MLIIFTDRPSEQCEQSDIPIFSTSLNVCSTYRVCCGTFRGLPDSYRRGRTYRRVVWLPDTHARLLSSWLRGLLIKHGLLPAVSYAYSTDCGSYPFGSYKLVFVDELISQRFDSATLTMPSHMIYCMARTPQIKFTSHVKFSFTVSCMPSIREPGRMEPPSAPRCAYTCVPSRVLPKIFLTAINGEMPHNCLSICGRGGVDLRMFVDRWIHGSGCPQFSFLATFNRKKMAVEIQMRRVPSIYDSPSLTIPRVEPQ